MLRMEAGLPRPLGATWTGDGVNFAVFSSHATRIEVALFDAGGVPLQRFDLAGRTGNVWHGLLKGRGAKPGAHYAIHAHGPDDPGNGHRFDPSIALIDPYARQLSASLPLRSRIVSGGFDWGDDQPPAIPWRDTVLYELHARGYTQSHPGVPEDWRGKYLGLTAEPVIRHLKSVGATTVELLPCHSFITEGFLQERGLRNYWGYNPLAWFSPANDYAVSDAVVEFKTMIKALHAARIEVVLDVVFNHTAEGNGAGPVLSLKGIDNSVYYRLMPDKREYENVTGCGNTVNCAHPQVRALIVDCLKYWAEEMHVDGFRFDLATVLARDANGFNERSALFKAIRAEPSLRSSKAVVSTLAA